MLFFKRILAPRRPEGPANRRIASRYAISPQFPIKTTIELTGRDELGEALRSSRDWTGRLLNLSDRGARLQVPPTVIVHRGDTCRLKLDLAGYELVLPATIAHISERRDSFLFGLKLELDEATTAPAYRQLIELVAVGATLKPAQPAQPDDSGYLFEQYAGERDAVLKIWRAYAGRTVAAFELQLKACRVRGLADESKLDYIVAAETGDIRRAGSIQSEEIHRLFQWIVPNLAPTVPEDVREFLEKFAA